MKNVGRFLSKTGTLLRPNKCEGGPSTTMKNKPSQSKIQSLTRREKTCVRVRGQSKGENMGTLRLLAELEAWWGRISSVSRLPFLNWILLFPPADSGLLMLQDKNWQEQTVVFNTFDFPQSEKPLSLPAPAFYHKNTNWNVLHITTIFLLWLYES